MQESSKFEGDEDEEDDDNDEEENDFSDVYDNDLA